MTRIRRLLGAIALSAMAGILTARHVSAAADEAPLTPRLNPTGRVIALAVDLKDADQRLGEVTIRISPDDEISISRQQFIAAATPILRPVHASKLATIPDEAGFIPLKTLHAHGYNAEFDRGLMELHFKPTVEQRPRGNLRVRSRPLQQGSTGTVKPADISGYVNLRAALDYIGSSASGRTGLDDPRLDIESAVRWKGFVLENEATYDAGTSSGIDTPFEDRGFRHHRLTRRGTRLVYDVPEKIVRVQAGDIDPLVTGFQRGSDLLGISVERSFRKLRPGVNIRPTGRRSFRIERPSTVLIKVNGLAVRQVRLRPGEYDLDDLPLRSGANNVQLLISDDVGESRQLDFTSYFDASLLAEGIYEWGFSAGVKTDYDDGTLSYDYDKAIASVFYRAGLTSELTGEIHLQGDADAIMGGASAFWATSLGFFGIEAAASYHASEGVGGALDIDWDVMRSGGNGGDGLRLSAALRSDTFATAGDEQPFEPYWLSLHATYSKVFPLDVTGTISARYSFATEDEEHGSTSQDRYGFDISLSRTLTPEISLGVLAGYSNERFDLLEYDGKQDGEFRLSVALSWRPDRSSRVMARYDTLDRRTSVSASRTVGRGIGQWSTSIEVEHDEHAGTVSASGDLSYYGNRAEVSLEHYSGLDSLALTAFDSGLTDQRTTLRVGTALAFADGVLAVGKPVRDSGFAIIARHKSLGSREVIVGSGDYVEAEADLLGPALINNIPSYSRFRIPYDVNDLPLGYDLGTGAFNLFAPYKAGYRLLVGSNYSVSAYGTLIGTDGKPIALLAGTARAEDDPDRQVTIFTNTVGRFGAQGLAPGRWTIEMATNPVTRFALVVPEDAVGLFKAGTLTPIETGK